MRGENPRVVEQLAGPLGESGEAAAQRRCRGGAAQILDRRAAAASASSGT